MFSQNIFKLFGEIPYKEILMKGFQVDSQEREVRHLNNLSIKSFLARVFLSPLLKHLLIENFETFFPNCAREILKTKGRSI